MFRYSIVLYISLLFTCTVFAIDKNSEHFNVRQYYSGKFGFYEPNPALNNGLLIGVDGATEFVNYNFILSGAIDVYPKQSIDIFKNPKPTITQQAMLLLPLHINLAYRIFSLPDADTKGYLGFGAGYYFYFYTVEYNSSSGGGILGGPTLSSSTESNNGGNTFTTAFAKLIIGRVFFEPRFYFAGQSEQKAAGSTFVVDPSGFAITFGFQYEN